jgi:putative spermidine/putrescine transport system permease protein
MINTGKLARISFWVLLIGYFLLPMLAMARFAFQTIPTFMLTTENIFEGWGLGSLFIAFQDQGVIKSTLLSLQLCVATIGLTFLVLIPLTTYVEVSAPKLRPYLTGATVLTWLVPPVALVVGVAATFRQVIPSFLTSPLTLTFFYSLWVLPFTYRAIDGQLRLIGARNLYEAAQSVGCGPITFFFKVIVPNLKSSLYISATLIFASVLGEFTFASLLLKQTMPVYLWSFQTSQARAGFALALVVMVATALILGFAVARLRRRGLNFSATGI